MLNDMAAALGDESGRNLIFAPAFAERVLGSQAGLLATVACAVAAGLLVPALASGVEYFDTMRRARGAANLIQGQRDFFGLHGFERLDSGARGQHGPWSE
jgi:6-phosphogluconate dehydrogenase